MPYSKQSIGRALRDAYRVIYSPAVAQLVRTFGHRSITLYDPNDNVLQVDANVPRAIGPREHRREAQGAFINELQEYVNLVFDFRRADKTPGIQRRHRERWEAKPVVFTENEIRAIHRATVACRMAGQDIPPTGKFEVAAVLGGSGVPVVHRLRHLTSRLGLAEFAGNEPRISVGTIALLGSSRPIDGEGDEAGLKRGANDRRSTLELLSTFDFVKTEGLAEDIANAKTEFHLMSIIAERMLGASPSVPDEVEQTRPSPHSRSVIRRLRSSNPRVPSIVVLSAPSPIDERAKTPETYAFMAKVLGLAERARVLITNTRLYEFQREHAHRMLGLLFGCEVAMDGYPYMPPYQKENSPRHIWNLGEDAFVDAMNAASPEEQLRFQSAAQEMLQELKAAIDASTTVVHAIEQELGPNQTQAFETPGASAL